MGTAACGALSPRSPSLPRTRSGSPPWSPRHHFRSLFSCDALDTADDGCMDSSRVLSSCGTSSVPRGPWPRGLHGVLPHLAGSPSPGPPALLPWTWTWPLTSRAGPERAAVRFPAGACARPSPSAPSPSVASSTHESSVSVTLSHGLFLNALSPFRPGTALQVLEDLLRQRLSLSLVETSVTAPAPAPPGGVNQSLRTHTLCKHLLLNIHEVL